MPIFGPPKALFLNRLACCAILSASFLLNAQDQVPGQDSSAVVKPIDQQRVLGVLPNYRTVDGTQPFAPITTKQKFTIALKNSYTPPMYLITGAYAAIYQMQDQNPSYGQGLKGYGKRYSSAFADQAISNLFTFGVVPAALHQDPRYFRLGSNGGGTGHRLRYAVARIVVARNDKGNWTFNYPEWIGNAAATAISNAYYPEDSRNARDNAQKLTLRVGFNAAANILTEFGPDLMRKFSRKTKSTGVLPASGDPAR